MRKETDGETKLVENVKTATPMAVFVLKYRSFLNVS